MYLVMYVRLSIPPLMTESSLPVPLAYTSKGCTPIEVLPVPNAYTTSEQTTGVFAFKMHMVILGDIFYVLLQNVVYALGTGRTSTGIHPFDL